MIALTLGLVACNQSDFGDPPVDDIPDPPPGPGTQEWGDTDIACTTKSDCGVGEVCENNLCQPARCDSGPYSSTAPLGPMRVFFADKEVVTLDGQSSDGKYWADVYAPSGSSLSYGAGSGGGSYDLGASEPVDIVGGNLKGMRPDAIAVAVSGSNKVKILQPGQGVSNLSVGLVPVALGAGDVDGDGVDELIALSAAGKIALCNVDENDCQNFEFDGGGFTGKDLAVADVDGDGRGEPVFLLRDGNNSEVLIWNPTSVETNEQQIIGAAFEVPFYAVAGGDIDGDKRGEVGLLEDGGWAGIAHDRLHLYKIAGTQFSGLTAAAVYRTAIDVAMNDIDGDGVHEVIVFNEYRDVSVNYWSNNELVTWYESELNVTNSPKRLALIDMDGDSATGKLLEGPELIEGRTIPTLALTFPPYDADHSDGKSIAWMGTRNSTEQSMTDTVSLSLGIEVGVEASFFDIFKAKVAASVRTSLEASTTVRRQYWAGDRFMIEPQPDLYGYEYGAVVLSCGCFHRYTYQLDDPAGLVGQDGGKFIINVPVGGNTTVWSTHRYNALAEARGDLPTIDVTTRIGDVGSYPSTPKKLDGSEIPEQDLVFRDVASFRASDVGEVGYVLAVGEVETNEVAMETEVGASFAVAAGGYVAGDVKVGQGRAYAVSVGSLAIFSGNIPPIYDDPNTPEDEYALNAYSFAPVIYRQRWTNAEGEEAGFYVVNYAVGQ